MVASPPHRPDSPEDLSRTWWDLCSGPVEAELMGSFEAEELGERQRRPN